MKKEIHTVKQPVIFANTCVCTNDCRKVLFYNHWFIQWIIIWFIVDIGNCILFVSSKNERK